MKHIKTMGSCPPLSKLIPQSHTTECLYCHCVFEFEDDSTMQERKVENGALIFKLSVSCPVCSLKLPLKTR